METVATKICTRCKLDKPRTEYFSRGDGTSRVQARCKVCMREVGAAEAKEWRRKNPDKAKNADLKKNHGITIDDYKAVLAEQGNACAICRKAPGSVGTGSNTRGNLAVDHCHTTNTFRGLLCTNCNLGLGSFFESVTLLENAAAYLKYHREVISKEIARRYADKARLDEAIASSLKELGEL